MSYLNDEVRDQGLDWGVTNGTKIDICSAEPAGYAGIAAVTLGNKTGLTVSAAEDGDVDGRKIEVPAITDGSVTATGTAAYWGLSNGLDTLVASGPLASTQAVTALNLFTLDTIDITIRDVA